TTADPMNIAQVSNFGNFGTTAVTATAKLQMDVLDLEATDEFRGDRWSVLLSGGIRCAHVSQRYDAIALHEVDVPVTVIESGHSFNGAGPTCAIEGRRHLGDTGLYLYGLGRISVLFGDEHQSAFSASGDTPASVTLDATAGTAVRDVVMPVTELELGAGYQ